MHCFYASINADTLDCHWPLCLLNLMVLNFDREYHCVTLGCQSADKSSEKGIHNRMLS